MPAVVFSATDSETVIANLFDLKGGNIQINYSTSGIDGKPHFSYKEGKNTRNFSGDEIRIAETDLGTIVSVTTNMTVDTGSTSFSVLIPNVNVTTSNKTSINTKGIETKHKFSPIPSFNKGQLDTYKVLNLNGKASFVYF